MSKRKMLTVWMLAPLLAAGTARTLAQDPPPYDDPPPPPPERAEREPEREWRGPPERPPMRAPWRLRPFERAPVPRGAWLGVQLSPVPAALAAHLGLEDQGLMIRNVFRGSAADEAGLQRYDVIVEADGNPVSPHVEAFSRHVRSKQPGDSLELTLIRRGQPQPMSLLPGESPPPAGRMELKYPEDDPDVLFWRDFGLRGKIWRPGPDGWIVEDLGELPEADRFTWFRERGLPERDRTQRDFLDDSLEQIRPRPYRDDREGLEVDEGRRVGRDGRVLHVRRQADGSIEVRRFHAADEEKRAEAATYPNLDELRAADPEAYELLQSVRPPRLRVPPRVGPGPERPARPAPPGPGVRDPRWQEWRERFFQGPLREPPRLRRPAPDETPEPPPAEPAPPPEPLQVEPAPPPPATPEPVAPPEPRVQFQVDPDGAITVNLRDGDAQMQMRFRSREALQRRAPALYQQFEELENQVR